MIRTHRALTALIVIALAGCQSVNVDTEYGPGMSLDGLGSTYAWLDPAAAPGDEWLGNAALNTAIRERIDDGLSSRGFRTDTAAPDFKIRYGLSTGYDIDPWRQDVKGEKGQLAVEIIDPDSNMLFWKGTAHAPIKPEDTIEIRQQRLTKAVSQILAKLPKKAG